MKKLQVIYLMLALLSAGISFGQNLEKHEWKQRVLIITSKDSMKLKEQIQLLQKDISGIQERKLAIYQVMPNGYAKGTRLNNWTKSTTFYETIKMRKENFEIILIGLDGGVKHRQTKLLTTKKLFTLIDGMPMRKAEMRKND